VGELVHTFLDLYTTHPVIVAMALYWIFSAAVSAMPMPTNGSMFYKWVFAFLHTLAGSVTRAIASKYPNFFTDSSVPPMPPKHEEPKA